MAGRGERNVLQLGGAASALSDSPDGKFLVVAGRDVLKITQWTEGDELDEMESNNGHTEGKEQRGSWEGGGTASSTESEGLQSPPTSGSHSHSGAGNNERQNGAGGRRAEGGLGGASLVGGRREAESNWEIVKNLRVGRTNLTYCSVDVKWNPSRQMEHLIGTAATNGAIVIWNVTQDSKKQERVIKEHNRTVNKICWNPHNGNLLCSASQDGTVRQFDLREVDSGGLRYQSAKCEVRDVQVHPSYPNYFASAYDNGSVQMWDFRNTKACVKHIVAGHQGLVLAIAWHPTQGSQLASAGRDRLIKVWDLKIAGSPHDSARLVQTLASVGRIQWRPRHATQLASAHSVMDSSVRIWDVNMPNLPLYSLTDHMDVVTGLVFDKTDDSSGRVFSCSKDGTLRQFDVGRDARVHYDHVAGTSVAWSPANECSFLHQPVARTDRVGWSLPGGSVRATSTGSLRAQAVAERTMEEGRAGLLHLLMDESLGEEDFSKESFVEMAERCRVRGGSVDELCRDNGAVAESVGRYDLAQLWRMLELVYGSASDTVEPVVSATKKVASSGTIAGNVSAGMSAFRDPLLLFPPSPSVAPPAVSDYLFLGSNALESEPFQSLMDGFTAAFVFDGSAGLVDTPANLPGDSKDSRTKIDPSLLIPEFSFTGTLREILDRYADAGDVQTCVMVVMVCQSGGVFSGSEAPWTARQEQQWLFSYIDLLSRFQLWTVVAEVVNYCRQPSVGNLNRTSTKLYPSCNSCKKPVQAGGTCKRCKSRSPCSICRQPVRGLYAWCQGCAHGGHAACLQEWFRTESLCPAACKHKCCGV